MKLYVIRHGQTDWNLAQRIQGMTDVELNETGLTQAEEAKQKLKEYPIDVILCSPLKRARKTAEIINQEKKLDIICDSRLVERGYGEIEGKNFEALDLRAYFDLTLNLKTRGVEPIKTLMERVSSVLDEIKEKYKGKNVLLVTHGGTIRAINAYFNGIPEDNILKKMGYGNCEVREYEYSECK